MKAHSYDKIFYSHLSYSYKNVCLHRKIFSIYSFHINKLNNEKASYKHSLLQHGYRLPAGKERAHHLEHRNHSMGV